MKIEILGTGCTKCQKVYENVKKAIEELGIDVEVEKVENIDKIINSGVILTPAVAVNGKVKVSGRIPDVDELKDLIK